MEAAGAKLLDRFFHEKRIRRFVARARDIAAAVDTAPAQMMPRTLIVKSKRDEAKLWLTVIDRVASLLSGERLLRLTSRMLVAAGELHEWLNSHKWSLMLPIALAILIIAKVTLGADLKPAQAKRLVLAPVFVMVLLSLIHSAVFVVVAGGQSF